LGEIGGHFIVMAGLPLGEYGTNAANTVAMHLRMSFLEIKYGLMVGVGGAVPLHSGLSHDIRLGDVVVSCPDGNNGGVVHYTKGKMEQDGFRCIGHMDRPPPILRSAVADLRTDGRSLKLLTRTITNAIRTRLGSSEGLNVQLETLQYQGVENDILFKMRYRHQLPPEPEEKDLDIDSERAHQS